ncbi:MAG: adenylyl-sulfate reductase [Betaproteobacteria bacterium]|nr:adenylyl-sulfate reductase [Betaproteobacteria bacterium]
MVFTHNPFAAVTDFFSPLAMQIYIVLMVLAVVIGTLFDVHHKGSAKFFARRQEKSRAAAQKQLSGTETFALAVETIAEAAVSGEFCKWPRRTSHLLMMYGFFLYVITTAVMVFGYPGAAPIPAILPGLWTVGALMILAGASWFFFFLRVNVAFDGDSRFHLGRADLFVGSLLASVTFALAWQYVQTAYANPTATWILFGLYMFFTALLFAGVPWSKFAHMFFKPAVAFQRRVEEANGSSDLPRPSAENYIVRS